MTWHKNIQNDPYEEYREEPTGCARTAFALLAFVLLVVFMFFASSCKSTQPLVQTRDSIRIETRYDSVYVYKHDSIYRDRWRSGDTTYIQVEKYQILYRDKLVQVHDTISTIQTEQVAVKYVPDYYRRTSTGFWVLLSILIVIIGLGAVRLYLKLKG